MALNIRSWIDILKLIISLSKSIFDLSISKFFSPASYRFWVSDNLYLSVKDSGVVEAVVVDESEFE